MKALIETYMYTPYVQFPSGLLFPDVVEVNFSLTVDPLAMRGPGFSTVNTSLQVINIFFTIKTFQDV